MTAVFEMHNHIVEHAQQDLLLLSLKSLDDESLVFTKKEERTTLSRAFTCRKDRHSVLFNVE